MKFQKMYKDEPNQWNDLTKEEAVETCSRYYNNPEEVIDSLKPGDCLNCMFSYIRVVSDD